MESYLVFFFNEKRNITDHCFHSSFFIIYLKKERKEEERNIIMFDTFVLFLVL